MSEMTNEQLAAIRERVEAATDLGGWTAKHPSFGDSWIAVEKPKGFTNVTAVVAMRIDRDDAEFIANAPTDILALLAEVDRLRAKEAPNV